MASERQYPLQESSLRSDDSWDSLESQLNGVEQEALFDAPAPSGYAEGSFPAISLTAISGSAVSIGGNTERKSPLADSLGSDSNWDSLEDRIDSIETNALLLEASPGLASGSFAEITLDYISGSATGRASAAGSFDEITLDAPEGYATGRASAPGSFSEITLDSVLGSAAGKANGEGYFSEITLATISGTATGKANATGSFAEITLNPASGPATGKANTAGYFSEITLSSPDGNAILTRPGYAYGSFSEITTVPIEGYATGAATCSGLFSEITLVVPTADITLTLFDIIGCGLTMTPGIFFNKRARRARYEFME